jgi:hypothetical protein
MELWETYNYHQERLFHGALCVEWYANDLEKSARAAEVYLFNKSTSSNSDKRLTKFDSVQMTKIIFAIAMGELDQKYSIIYAGYGSGKSHYALTVSEFLHPHNKQIENLIFENLSIFDPEFVQNRQMSKKYPLIIPINGISNPELFTTILYTAKKIIEADGNDASSIGTIYPYYETMLNRFNTSSKEYQDLFIQKIGVSNDEFREAMEIHNPSILRDALHAFPKVFGSEFFIERGSVSNAIERLSNIFCGDGKPYSKLLLLFDEFGQYMEFACGNPQFAGEGVLQQLFEGIQNSNSALIVFSQFELNTYISKMNEIIKSEAQKYASRFSNSVQYYLEANFKTLVGSLIEKKTEYISLEKLKLLVLKNSIDRDFSLFTNNPNMSPNFTNKFITDYYSFWPFSPYAAWVLCYFSDNNQYLSGRSALSIIGKALNQYKDTKIDASIAEFSIPATSLYDLGLGDLFEEIEGNDSGIANKYLAVISKIGASLSIEQKIILQAIVISEKIQLFGKDKEISQIQIANLSNLNIDFVNKEITKLESEINMLDWDSLSHRYTIQTDLVTSRQFAMNLFSREKQKGSPSSWFLNAFSLLSNSTFNADLNKLLFSNFEGDFALDHQIYTTSEWCYESSITTLAQFKTSYSKCLEKCIDAISHKKPKGQFLYVFCTDNDSPNAHSQILENIQDLNPGPDYKPAFCQLLVDKENRLALAGLKIKALDRITDNEKQKLGSTLIERIRLEFLTEFSDVLDNMLDTRIVIWPGKQKFHRKKQYADILFSCHFPKAIPFPCDGFSTQKNLSGIGTCREFIIKLFLNGRNAYANLKITTPPELNRLENLLKNCWGVFDKSPQPQVVEFPQNPLISELFNTWDNILKEEKEISLKKIQNDAIQPPYGCNTIVADLLLAVFYAGRSERLILRPLSKDMKYEDFISGRDFFGKDAINTEVINSKKIVQRVRTDKQKWIDLLSQWDAFSSYTSVKRCYNDTDISTLPEEMEWHYDKNKQKTEEGFQERAKVEQKLKEYQTELTSGTKINRLKVLEILQWYKSMLDNLISSPGEFWYIDDFKKDIENRVSQFMKELGDISKLEQYLLKFFPTKIDQVNSRKKAITRYLDAYKNLELTKCVLLINNIIEKIELTKCEAEKFIPQVETINNKIMLCQEMYSKITNKPMYSEIQNLKQYISSIEEFLAKQDKNYLEFIGFNFIETYDQIQRIKHGIASNENEMQSIRTEVDLPLVPVISELENRKEKIGRLKYYYDKIDSNNNIENWAALEEMLVFIIEVSDHIHEAVTYSLLDRVVENSIQKTIDINKTNWDVQSIILDFKEKEIQKRHEQSKLWFDWISNNYKKVVDFEGCLQLLNSLDLSKIPSYVTKEDLVKTESIRLSLNNEISKSRILQITHLYETLSEKEKIKFLEEIKYKPQSNLNK